MKTSRQLGKYLDRQFIMILPMDSCNIFGKERDIGSESFQRQVGFFKCSGWTMDV